MALKFRVSTHMGKLGIEEKVSEWPSFNTPIHSKNNLIFIDRPSDIFRVVFYGEPC